MKKLSFLAMAAFGLLFAACSDKDAVANEEQGREIGEGYIALSINLPTAPQSLTRATDDNGYDNGNFDLDNGLDGEFAVNDAYLLIFNKNADEAAATFKTAFKLNTTWTGNPDPHVTVNSDKVVKKVGSTIAEGDLALVVLNANDVFKFAEKTGTELDEQTVQVNNKGTYVALTTFGALQSTVNIKNSAVDNAKEMTSNGFYMTNSPLYDKKGSTKSDSPKGTKVRTLVPIEHIYPTQEAATSGVASEIFVERGVAKVTLAQLASGAKLGTQTAETTPQDLAITILGWSLDQTNTLSYPVRSTDGTADFAELKSSVSLIYRFTGNTELQDATDDYKYRGYFAKDPNYASVVDEGELTHISGDVYKNTFGNENPQYCFENTFDVANQIRRNTTLAQLKVQVGNGTDDLYTVGGVTNKIYPKGALETLIKAETFKFLQGEGKVGSASSSDIGDVTLENDGSATKQKIKAIAVTDDGTKFLSGAKKAVDDDLAKSSSVIRARVGAIVKYVKGVSYYAIRIKHFGDDLTPWHVGKAESGKSSVDASVDWVWDASGDEDTTPTAGTVYPSNNANNYLGRYGVLRNNWYDLRVKDIKTLGSADPIDYTKDNTTDDELDGYINVQINVLSWARRTQQWSL